MDDTAQQVRSCLEEFKFESLFLEILGWQPPRPPLVLPSALLRSTALTPSHVRPLAIAGNTALVEIAPPPGWAFSPALRWQLYGAIAHHYPDPLLVFVDSSRQRSLWMWGQGRGEEVWRRTYFYAKAQPDFPWVRQLSRLIPTTGEAMGGTTLTTTLTTTPATPLAATGEAAGGVAGDPSGHPATRESPPDPPGDGSPPPPDLTQRLFPDFSTLALPHVPRFQTHLELLTQQIQGVPTVAERRYLALVILSRLIATVSLQRRGWLDRGDDWFLQNKFGQSQQFGPDRFFREFLQPLWFQGFTLPPTERPLAVQQRLGEIPFLPTSPFQRHPLEHYSPHIQIPDAAFEPILDWLGDVVSAVAIEDLPDFLAPLLEGGINHGEKLPLITPAPLLQALCDRPFHTVLLQRVQSLTQTPASSLEDWLMTVSPAQARPILAALPKLAMLDPACGSGRYLLHLMATLEHLYAALMTLTQTERVPGSAAEFMADLVAESVSKPLPEAISEALPEVGPEVASPPDRRPRKGWRLSGNPSLQIQREILKGPFYGVDRSTLAVELARLQIFLHLSQSIDHSQDFQTLPDPAFNILPGNSLVGLVTVDAERFDQVQARPPKPPAIAPDVAPEPSPQVVFQGNLLQPLVAESYRSIVAERQIRLEHYRDQTHLLQEVDGIPGYVQAAFLRDRISELDQTAQAKLNQLLLNEFSRELGIRYRQSDSQGRLHRRLLNLEDIEALQPFHWGFHAHRLLQQQGGFDVIVCHPPWTVLQPTNHEFFITFQDLFERKGISFEAFRHHQQQLFRIDSDLATAWRDFCGQFTYLSDYFRRSADYGHSAQPPQGQSQMRLYPDRLFLERSIHLLRPGGCCAFLLPPDLWHQANAQPLREWLQTTTQMQWVVEISNHQAALGTLPHRTALSLLQVCKAGSTADYPHHSYTTPQDAPTPESLGYLLQSAIDLPEEGSEVG